MAATAQTTLRNFIGGEFVDSAEGATEDVLNPSTGEVIAQAPLSDAVDVDRAVTRAREAFATWSVTTPAERSLALLKFADALEANADVLADLESANAGKPRANVLGDEVPVMA